MKKIWDPIRRKEVEATPEEVIRQKVITWLVKGVGVPQMKVEVEVSIPNSNWYADILVRSAKAIGVEAETQLLIEVKRPSVSIDGIVFAQLERYMKLLNPLWVVATNGKEFFYFKKGESGYSAEKALPPFQKW